MSTYGYIGKVGHSSARGMAVKIADIVMRPRAKAMAVTLSPDGTVMVEKPEGAAADWTVGVYSKTIGLHSLVKEIEADLQWEIDRQCS